MRGENGIYETKVQICLFLKYQVKVGLDNIYVISFSNTETYNLNKVVVSIAQMEDCTSNQYKTTQLGL